MRPERAKDSPSPGRVEGGRVEAGLSADPDRRQEGGAQEGVEMGCRVWQAQTSGTDEPETLLPSQLSQVPIADGGSDSTCPALPTSRPCLSQRPRQQGLYSPAPNTSSSQPRLTPSPCRLLFQPSDTAAPTFNATRLAATRVTFWRPRVRVRHP